eukprot:jgi/Botrbrau1/8890/Bobra.0148s0010.1
MRSPRDVAGATAAVQGAIPLVVHTSPASEKPNHLKSPREAQSLKGFELVLAACSLALWMFSSSALILINRHIMVNKKFPFPLALTGLGQWASWFAGFLLIKSGLVRARGAPSLRTYVTRLVPIVLCSAGSLGFGNAAYLSLSVSFVQILKVLVPAFTFAACVVLGLERLQADLTLAVLLIAGGTSITTVVESGTAGFSWLGFSVMTLSVFLEALRVVFMQVMMGQTNYGPMEMLVFLGPPIGGVLMASSLVWEWRGILDSGFSIMLAEPLIFAVSAVMGFFVNLSTAWAIQTTSSLTFKVFGTVKNTVVVWVGVLMGDRLSGVQVVGYAISVLGFGLYTYAKMQPASDALVAGPVIKKNR